MLNKNNNSTKVSVIGLGTMGSAIAKVFIKKGFKTTVWNRSENKSQALVAEGAIFASTVLEAIAGSPVIVICVLNYDVVNIILEKHKGELAGKVIVNLTNGTPEQARKVAKWVADNDSEYIDGGIMAIPPMIGLPEAFILYSGSNKAFEDNKEIFDTLGTASFIGSDPGLASLYDLALLSAMYGMLGGYLHAVTLVSTENIKAIEFTPIVINWLHAMIQVLPHLAQQIDASDYSLGGVVSNLEMNATSFVNILEASKSQGIKNDLMSPMKTLLDNGVKEGYGKGDISALVKMLLKQ